MIKRRLLPQKIADQIRKRIVEGIYPPDTFLPSERELAQSLDASRTTISSALTVLSNQGLIEQIPGRGTRVLGVSNLRGDTIIAVGHYLHVANVTLEHVGLIEGICNTLTGLGLRYELISLRKQIFTLDKVKNSYSGAVCGEVFDSTETICELENQGFPIVVANLERDYTLNCTCVNHRKVFRQAVDLLVSLGHRQIAFLGLRPDTFFYRSALEGYIEGLKAAEIEPDCSMIAYTEHGELSEIYSAARSLLESQRHPTAIVAGRDYIAKHVCRAIADNGLILGRDVSVVGYDDCTWEEEQPYLTTFREPCYDMGAVAARMLADRLMNGYQLPQRVELDTPLVMRKSAGPLLP